MGFPLLVRRHLYIETGPWSCFIKSGWYNVTCLCKLIFPIQHNNQWYRSIISVKMLREMVAIAKFNSLCLSDAIWWHKSGSALGQVMACCLTAPSHYRNQCWLIINGFSGIHMRAFPHEIFMTSICKVSLKITFIKLLQRLLGINGITLLTTYTDITMAL